MNIEDIKVKKEYYIHILIDSKFQDSDEQSRFLAYSTDNEGNLYDEFLIDAVNLQTLEPAPQTGEKLYKRVSPPTHDPCRLFKKGDRVRVVEWNGRHFLDLDHSTKLETGCIAEIYEDEKDIQEEGWVSVIYQDYIRCVPPCYLELVTPVEELEPYCVVELCNGGYAVYKDMKTDNNEVCIFWTANHPHAKEAAEAECARLNAEYRKGMEK